ncbi:unnamed protein product [Caenorhabditis angaria]|uniref:Uncharacterized protein n=1 Tax=Caenorhabditis angaria TaxID=860376 RepID=A0A9P1I3H0_9PELO|nr:unnamed protein product [Caenorhabditis angaria]
MDKIDQEEFENYCELVYKNECWGMFGLDDNTFKCIKIGFDNKIFDACSDDSLLFIIIKETTNDKENLLMIIWLGTSLGFENQSMFCRSCQLIALHYNIRSEIHQNLSSFSNSMQTLNSTLMSEGPQSMQENIEPSERGSRSSSVSTICEGMEILDQQDLGVEVIELIEIIDELDITQNSTIDERIGQLQHEDNYLQMLLSNNQSLQEAFQELKTDVPTNTIEKLLSKKTVTVEEKQLKKSNDELNSIKNNAYGQLKKLRLILSDKLYDNLRPLWLIEEDTGLKDDIIAISKDNLISVDLLRANGGIFDKNGKDEVLKYLKRLDGNRKSADICKEIQKKKKDK